MISILLEAALRALLVAATVWIGLRLLRVRYVPAQKAAWGLVLACAVAMPMVMRWKRMPQGFTLSLPAGLGQGATVASPFPPALSAGDEATPSPLAAAHVSVRRQEVHELPTAGSRYPAPVVTTRRSGSGLPFDTAAVRPSAPLEAASSSAAHATVTRSAALHLPSATMLATLLYAAVCVALFARMAFGLILAFKLWAAAEPFIPQPSAGGAPHPTDGLRVRFSRNVASPATIGSGVLLPEECLAWDDEKLRIVLAHERAHVRQGDFYLQLAAGLYAAAFWFSPLGWWLKRILCDLGEAISDRAGLEEAASRASYAQVLLEFAALPRPTAIGVAMARSNNLSQRIERLLNESSFRQAFAGSRRRILTALLLVPIALFAGTALIRVEAQSAQSIPIPPTSPAVAAEPESASESAPSQAPAPAADPASPSAQDMAPSQAPPPPVPPAPAVTGAGEVRDPADMAAAAELRTKLASATSDDVNHSVSAAVNLEEAQAYAQAAKAYGSGNSYGYSYSYSSNGDSYALVTEPGKHISFSGEWNDSTRAAIDQARKLAHGKFLWFTHQGKTYLVDDPAIIAQLETLYKPIEELGVKQEALGKQQEELGRQQEELGRKQEQASVPTPDISKEMAELNDAVARLNAKKGGSVSAEELADLEGKIGEIQGRIGEVEGKVGEKQGEIGALQGELGAQQGRLGVQQGALGAEQGKLEQQVDRKVKSIIDQTIHNGKARPVQ